MRSSPPGWGALFLPGRATKPISVYWEFSRPFTLLPPAIGIVSGALVALGAVSRYAGETPSQYAGDFPLGILIGYMLLGSLVAALLNAASNGLNQMCDVKNDAVNQPSRPLPAKRLSMTHAAVFSAILFFAALTLAWLVAPRGYHHFFWLVLGGALATFAYSAPPARTKRHGILANLTISLPRGLLLRLAGWAVVAPVWYAEAWFLGFIFMVFTIGAATTKDFADVAGDRAAGCMTLPVKYGAAKAARIISPFLYLPWALCIVGAFIPLPSGQPLLSASRPGLIILGIVLFAYGLLISRIILAESSDPEAAGKRRSWKHMYLLMMAAQVGLALVYLF